MSAATATLDDRSPSPLGATAPRQPVAALRAARGFVPILRSEFDAYAAGKGLDFDEENLLHRLLGHAHWADGTVRGGYTHLAGLWRMGPSGRRRLGRLLGRLAEKGVVEVVPDTGRDDGCVRVVDYAELVANGAARGRAGSAQPLVPKRAAGRARPARPASHNASREEEQVEEPPYPPPTEAPAPPRTAGGNGHLEHPETAGDERPAELAGAVFEGFRQPVPPGRRAAYDRQIVGPGGQRLVAAATRWLAHGGSLAALVARAAAGPQPGLVHNWPAFFAARLEALEPPGDAPPEDLEAGGAAAAIDTEVAARRAEAAAGHVAMAAARAEADAISGVLGDELLAAVLSRVAPDLPGPLGRSALALTRGVVTFCRAAYASRPGDLAAAVSAALDSGVRLAENEADPWPPLPLRHPPVGTATLQDRIRTLLHYPESAPPENP